MVDKKYNRGIIVLAALAIQICLGVIYAWGPIKNILKEAGWTDTQAALPFSIGLASFALVMVAAGRWQDKVGPKKVATVGGILYGLGYIIASMKITPAWLNIFYGLIGGAGIGFAYVCPIAALVKWFPDKKGTISGIAVAGFGGGAFVFSKLIPYLAEGGATPEASVSRVLIFLGILFLIVVSGSAQILRNPPEGYKPPGWKKTDKDEKKTETTIDYSAKEMLAVAQFWMLWFMFAAGATAGLMTIGHVATYAKEVFIKIGNMDPKMAASPAATIVGVLSIFNGLGRIFWGAASDKLGRSRAMFLMFALQGIAMFSLARMETYYTIMGIAALIGFNFGGNFALFPSATADFFGTKNLGINYGLVFTSYGVAGIFGPVLGGEIFDRLHSYNKAFMIAGILCFVAAVISFVLKKPEKKGNRD